MIAYKLFRQRKNRTLGSLFINRKQVLEEDVWYTAENHPTKGYSVRPGWHTVDAPVAPHLSKNGRVWMKVEIEDYYQYNRPASQGRKWYIAKQMRILKENSK